MTNAGGSKLKAWLGCPIEKNGPTRHAVIAFAAVVGLSLCAFLPIRDAAAYDEALAAEARTVALRAARFYQSVLSLDGSYVWQYAPDLSARRGEGAVGPNIGWIEPPGTPAVGAAFLRLYEATEDPVLLNAAVEVGSILLRTQLLSGGWYLLIELDPDGRARWCYRVRVPRLEDCAAIQGNKAKNRTLLDDDTTQSVLRFLILLESMVDAHVLDVRGAVLYGLDKLSEAQFPNGAWPIMSDRRPENREIKPVGRTTLPATWSRDWVKPSGGPYYIVNDNAVCDTLTLFLIAAHHYGRQSYVEVAVRAGEFLLNAQLPEPHPGWAQTYDDNMQPVWGRQFEPPSATSRESAGAIRCLTELYEQVGDERYLKAALRAADWLERVRLPDGDWARFYELETNRPLYVNSENELTYEPKNLRDGYSMKSEAGVPRAIEYARSSVGTARLPYWSSPADDLSAADLEAEVRRLVGSVNEMGVWEEGGWIDSETFVNAMFAISRYLDAHP